MLFLKKLSCDDDHAVYEMMRTIEVNENSFTNPVKEMSYEEYKEWLTEMDNWDKEEGLPKGYVGQTIFWLYDGETPIGFGKIRHELTDNSRRIGGNIGYAIGKDYRGKGYGTVLLQLLLEEARKMNIEEIMLTVDKYNYASKKVIENNEGILFDENDERWYFKF